MSAVRSGASTYSSVSALTRMLAVAVRTTGASPTLRRVRLSAQWMYWICFSVTLMVLVADTLFHLSSPSCETVRVTSPTWSALRVLPSTTRIVSSLDAYATALPLVAEAISVTSLPTGTDTSSAANSAAQVICWVFLRPVPETEIVAVETPSVMVIVAL